MKLGEVCEITSSKRIFQEEYVDAGVPFFRTKEIVELSTGNEISLELFISEERFNEIRGKFGAPLAGDLLLPAVGTIGVSWVVDDRTFYFKDGNLLWLRRFRGCTSAFVKLVMDANVETLIREMTNGAAYRALTIEKLVNLTIPLPPLEVQHQIVQRIEAERTLVEANKKLIELMKARIEETMQRVWN